ncbi:hypothetical protein ABZ568_12240 [Streptomyces olindensis]|uniref:Uncharacterized protein n=1 Tax=Streptomyces olindensis TaxID=358823 RepID=A0ABV2XT22_9ACTN
MTKYIVEPPQDLPLSAKVKALRKAYEDAKEKLSEYRHENAAYATRNVTREYEAVPRYEIPALAKAEQELQEQEVAAVAAGKDLPDRDSVLRPIQAKADEYKRMVPALTALMEKAHREYSDALRDELVTMGLKEAQKAAKARQEWERLYKAAMDARRTLERHAGLFAWCATSGDYETTPLEGASAGNNVESWELAKDGRLSTEAAIALGYEGVGVIDGLIVMPDPVTDEQAEAEAEFWRTYKPKMFIAKADGYGSDWEH